MAGRRREGVRRTRTETRGAKEEDNEKGNVIPDRELEQEDKDLGEHGRTEVRRKIPDTHSHTHTQVSTHSRRKN